MDNVSTILARNLRSVRDLTLEVRGLTALVGRNGSGKSTLLEVCQILSRIPSTEFASELVSIHGGPRALARDPALPIEIGATFAGLGRYWAAIEQVGSNPQFSGEIVSGGEGGAVLSREGGSVTDSAGRADLPRAHPGRSLLVTTLPAVDAPLAERWGAALGSIDVHLPFETLARWGERTLHRDRGGMREPQTLGNSRRLSVLGQNLPSVYFYLKNEQGEEHWRETLDLVRLGLGTDVATVTLPNYAQGEIGLALKFRGFASEVPAAHLSDGMLAWLGFVAMVRLPHSGGLLAIDEPEQHFEPRLLARVVDLLEDHARTRPVLVATHSDRFLDALQDPAASVVTCDLNEQRETVLLRPDRDALARWLDQFGGYGELRAAGHEGAVLAPVGK